VHDRGEGRRRWDWLGWAVRVGPARRPDARARIRLDALHRPASMAARAIPPVLVVVGLALAVLSATVVEDLASDGIATLGVEAGAALWFGGAVAWSVRRTTVGRALLVVGAAVAGLVLIALALALGWSGAALDLSMEFGVGALAIVVIDLIVLGTIHPGLDTIASRASGTLVDVDVGWRWPPVTVRLDAGTRAGPASGDA
jgi:hypothetical protein